MTTKLNLNPLINYFSDKDPKIASQLSRLAQAEEKPAKKFESGFLDQDLRSKVDSFIMNKKATPADLEAMKTTLAEFLETSDRFSDKEAARQMAVLKKLRNARELGLWFYGMIQTAAGDKAIRNASEHRQMAKIAEALVEIADSLDTTDPALAQEADEILATITAQMMPMPAGAPPSDGPGMMPPLLIDEPEEELPLDEEVEDVEYDEIPVDEFKSMAEGLPLRLTDRSRKERWLAAYEDAALGLKYMQKGREKIERAHKVLDEAGDRIRFKTDFKW